MASVLQQLASWYRLQCDGDWEHQYGIKIDTLDNPGWSVKIDLTETKLAEESFDELKIEFDDDIRWIRCWKVGSEFHAACGPERLEAALQVFLSWAEGRTPPPRAS